MLPSLLLLTFGLPVLGEGADERYEFILGLSRKGMHEMVIQEASDFLDEHPRHERAAHARYCLANAYFDTGEHARAGEHYDPLARRGDFEFAPESAFRLGQCELEQEHLGKARAAFEATLRADRDYLAAPAHYFLGEALFRADKPGEAEPHYEEARRRDPQSYGPDAEYALAWCAFRRKAHADVIARVAEFAPRASGERQGELWFLAGESALELGQPAEALVAYRRVEGGEYHDDALRGAGFAAAELGQHAEAASWFGSLLQAYPESEYAGEAALHRGVQLFQDGDAEAAERVLSLDILAHDAEAGLWRAQAQRELGQTERALATIDAAIDMDAGPELSERLRSMRGELLLGLGRSDEAARAFEGAGSEYGMHAAAIAELNAGRATQAEQLARGLLENPEHTTYRRQARLTLAEALFEQERYDEARDEFEALLGEDGGGDEQRRCRLRVAWCLFFAGQYGAAFTGFDELASADPDAEEAEEALFMAARSAEVGADERAAAAYRRYLEHSPEGVRRHEAYLSLARLEPDEARGWLERLLSEAPDEALAVEAHLALGEELSAAEDHAGAIPHYRHVIEAEADAAGEGGAERGLEAAYGLAWSHYQRTEYDEASAQLVEVARRASTPGMRVAALELLVWSEAAAERSEQSLAAFREFAQVCDEEQRRFDSARTVSEALRRAERAGDAQQMWARLMESVSDPRVAVAICVEQTHVALEREETEVAAAHARAAHEYAPEDPALAEALFFVGEAWFAQGEHARAVEFYRLATVDGAPTACEALYKEGFALLELAEHQAAAAAFGRLVEEYEGCELAGESRFLAGEAHFRDENWSEAVASLEGMRAAAPRHEALPKALFRLGLAYGELEDWDASQRVLAELVRKHEAFAHRVEAELARGRALARLGEERGARAAFARVLEADDGVFSARARLELGRLALEQGQADAALSEFLKVAVLYAYADEVSEALFLAGGVLEEQDAHDNARKQYEELLERFPESRYADLARERLSRLAQR